MTAAVVPAVAGGVAPNLSPGSMIRGVGQNLPPGSVISGVAPSLLAVIWSTVWLKPFLQGS